MHEAKSGDNKPRWLKPVSEFGPLILFFAAYYKFGLLPATAVLIAATLVSLALVWFLERRIPYMPLITAVVVALFGGLTLLLADETWIKMKPTIVQIAFAAILLGGLASGRALLKPLLGAAWKLDDAGWRKLTIRFSLFFLSMAGLNELVWRTQSTDFWVNFKVFGILGLTIAFAVSQVFLLQSHSIEEEKEVAGRGK
ncbi:MAG: septation protein A [Kiloniellales bacterium]|nr:septation protein A [Kiloniellales bacterium]